MDRRQALSLIMVGTALVASERTVASLTEDLSSKVKRLADAYAAAWNASDMDAMAALYTDDVHWVNIVGMHWQGKRQVDQAHRARGDARASRRHGQRHRGRRRDQREHGDDLGHRVHGSHAGRGPRRRAVDNPQVPATAQVRRG